MVTGSSSSTFDRAIKDNKYPNTTIVDGKIFENPCENLRAIVAITSKIIAILNQNQAIVSQIFIEIKYGW